MRTVIAARVPLVTVALVTADEALTRKNNIAGKLEALGVTVSRVVKASTCGEVDYGGFDVVVCVLDKMLPGQWNALESACHDAGTPLYGISHQRSSPTWQKLAAHLGPAKVLEPAGEDVELNAPAAERPRVLKLAGPEHAEAATHAPKAPGFYEELAGILQKDLDAAVQRERCALAAGAELGTKLLARDTDVTKLETRNEELRRKLAETADSKTDVHRERAELRERVRELEVEIQQHRTVTKQGREAMATVAAERDEAVRQLAAERADVGELDLTRIQAVLDALDVMAKHGVVDLAAALGMIRKAMGGAT